MWLISELKQLKADTQNLLKTLIKLCSLKRINPNVKIYTYKSLLNIIEKRNDVCHIIATGSSALDAYKQGVVKPGDYIIGMNFAAFLPYKFDLYLCEDMSKAYKTKLPFETIKYERIKHQYFLLKKRKENISNLIFNTFYWSDPDFIGKLMYDIDYSVVFGRFLVIGNHKKLFNAPSFFFSQYTSTVIDAAILAHHSGFKNIIIHGLDFSGPSIYHDEGLQREIGMEPPTPYVSKEKKHPAAAVQEPVWNTLIENFSKNGTNIYCASSNSAFSIYAPIWLAQ
jgi:hypothetical protein